LPGICGGFHNGGIAFLLHTAQSRDKLKMEYIQLDQIADILELLRFLPVDGLEKDARRDGWLITV
jgi:hypothetical protein